MSPVTFLRISSSLASLSSFFVSLLSLSVPFFLFATRVDERHGWKDRTERLWRNAGRAYSHYPQPVDFWQMEDGQRPHCSTCSRHVLVRGCESEFRLTAPTVNAWCALSLYPKQTGVNISIPRTKAFYYSSSAQFFSIVRFFSFHSPHAKNLLSRKRSLSISPRNSFKNLNLSGGGKKGRSDAILLLLLRPLCRSPYYF